MRAEYQCPKCKRKVIVNSVGSQPHFKRPICLECSKRKKHKRTMHLKEIYAT